MRSGEIPESGCLHIRWVLATIGVVCIRVWGWFGGGLLVTVFYGGGVKDCVDYKYSNETEVYYNRFSFISVILRDFNYLVEVGMSIKLMVVNIVKTTIHTYQPPN
jgi:hypothetical protein